MIFTGEMLSLLNTKFSEKSNLLYIFKDISSEDLILKGEERERNNESDKTYKLAAKCAFFYKESIVYPFMQM